jgi:hypothetical protein
VSFSFVGFSWSSEAPTLPRRPLTNELIHCPHNTIWLIVDVSEIRGFTKIGLNRAASSLSHTEGGGACLAPVGICDCCIIWKNPRPRWFSTNFKQGVPSKVSIVE